MCQDLELPTIGGVYKHFKGKLYVVESVGRDTTTCDLRVTYIEATKALDPNAIRHHRKLSEWNEIVDKPEYGYHGERFTKTNLYAELYKYGLTQQMSSEPSVL